MKLLEMRARDASGLREISAASLYDVGLSRTSVGVDFSAAKVNAKKGEPLFYYTYY